MSAASAWLCIGHFRHRDEVTCYVGSNTAMSRAAALHVSRPLDT